ncbi:MAG: hypothetical protein ACJKSS_02330 [Patescibacteria group bacterium UBA2103]
MSHIIKLIILVIAILLILSFFGISLQSIIESPAGQANIQFVWNLILVGWNWIVDFLVGLYDAIAFWN